MTSNTPSIVELAEMKAVCDRIVEEAISIRDEIEKSRLAIKPKQTLRDQVFMLCVKYEIHEVLEALSDLFYIQSELCEFGEDKSNLKEITQFVSEAQSVSELISDSFEMS
jgi:hypothetical protein